MRLEGKTALVTGASNGIGRAIAIGFAKEGADVAIGYYEHPENADEVLEIVKSYGRKGYTFHVDIAVREENEKMIEEAVERFGRLDILMNNAGVRDVAPLHEVTKSLWDHAVGANLGGLFAAAKAAAPHMIKQGKGKIINIASLNGIRQSNTERSAYCTTKTGIIGMTKALAAELGPYHICVNAISPGSIETNMGGLKGQYTQALVAEREKYIPMRYRAKPDVIVGPAIFLASDDADYVTGVNLPVDGGWSVVD